MIKPTRKYDLILGYLAQGLNVGAGLILLPAVLMTLDADAVGIWFVFLTLGALAQVLEFGFQPTIARNVSFVFTGATALTKEGVPFRSSSNDSFHIDIELLGDLIFTSKRLYFWIATLAAFMLYVFGSIYVLLVTTPNQNQWEILLAWLLFAAGQVLNLYFNYINAFLIGRGDVSQSSKVTIVSRCGMIFLGSILLFSGLDLLGLGVASLISTVFSRVLSRRYFSCEAFTRTALKTPKKNTSGELLRTFWHNAKRMAVSQISAFLMIRGNILIGTYVLGAASIAPYSLTLSALMALSSVSTVYLQLQLPRVVALQMRGDRLGIRQIYLRAVFSGVLSIVAGAILLGLFANSVSDALGSRVEFLGGLSYWSLAVVMTLEVHHVIAATYITTRNEVPFVTAAVLSAVMTVALSATLVFYLGIPGLIIAQGIVQLAYNNWKWPIIAYKHLFH
jgi:O-antigen/teichoic acid export membrane protein